MPLVITNCVIRCYQIKKNNRIASMKYSQRNNSKRIKNMAFKDKFNLQSLEENLGIATNSNVKMEF